MKKSLLYIPFAALALASCSNTEDMIFSSSAAERLEESKADAVATLTDQGGLWAMEYFTNSDEAGYVMLFRFDKNGSVEVSVNHQWQADNANEFAQETSLWEIVSDNGTVLSFSSYNSLFHIFSDPEDIDNKIFPDAPVNPDRDNEPIDETGYGHEGDYEFQIMKSTDPSTMRMLGKKRGYNIYMHRLPADTDEKAYLEGISDKVNALKTRFSTYILTDRNGYEYEISNLAKGVPSQFPRDVVDEAGNVIYDGDAITQTTSANGIFTYTGFRFARNYKAKRADESEMTLTEFTWAEDGSLVNEEQGLRIAAPSAAEVLNGVTYTWAVDKDSFTGQFATAYEAAAAAVVDVLGAKYPIGAIEFDWSSNNNAMSHRIFSRLGNKNCHDFFTVDRTVGTELTAEFTNGNATAERYNEQIPALWAFKQLFFQKFNLAVNDVMNPSEITFTLASDPESGFTVSLK